MKTLPLRELLRRPTNVKRLTSAGQSVRITDRGKPLWLITPADGETSRVKEAEEIAVMDELLDEVIREPKSIISAAQIILDSRR